MIQRQHKLEVPVPCHDCDKPMRMFENHGRTAENRILRGPCVTFSLECFACNLTTARFVEKNDCIEAFRNGELYEIRQLRKRA